MTRLLTGLAVATCCCLGAAVHAQPLPAALEACTDGLMLAPACPAKNGRASALEPPLPEPALPPLRDRSRELQARSGAAGAAHVTTLGLLESGARFVLSLPLALRSGLPLSVCGASRAAGAALSAVLGVANAAWQVQLEWVNREARSLQQAYAAWLRSLTPEPHGPGMLQPLLHVQQGRPEAGDDTTAIGAQLAYLMADHSARFAVGIEHATLVTRDTNRVVMNIELLR